MKTSYKIEKMFDEISLKYDFMNNLISMFTHYFVKKVAVKKLEIKGNSKVIDLCCGTGDIARILAKNKMVESVVGVDFSQGMLNMAKRKTNNLKITYLNENCLNLPFNDNEFDCATMFFGLRNVEDENKVLQEIKRVLKNGGQFLYMDFSKENKILNKIFDFFVLFFVKIFCQKNKNAYEYLIKSKNSFHERKELLNIFQQNGFVLKKEYKFMFGVILCQLYKK